MAITHVRRLPVVGLLLILLCCCTCTAADVRSQGRASTMHTITNMKGGNCPILPLVEDQRVWLEVEAGTTRKFLLHLPATSAKIGHHRTTHNNNNNKNKNDAFKGLLVLFHGLGDECENFLDATGFVAHAAQHGFAVASACGLSGYLGRAWNAGVCCGFNEDGPDEVAFARAVVESVSAYTCINFTGRAMAAGFSNGAMLAEMIGCTAPDVFSAVASVGGVTALRPGLAGGLKACDDAAAVHVERPSVLLIHGDDDPKVPWSGRTLLRFPDIPTNVARWAARSGCPARNTTTLNTTHFVNAIYSNCGEDDGAVEIVRHKGGHHQWPMTDGFDTTAYIVDFGLHHGWSSTSSTHTTRKRS